MAETTGTVTVPNLNRGPSARPAVRLADGRVFVLYTAGRQPVRSRQIAATFVPDGQA